MPEDDSEKSEIKSRGKEEAGDGKSIPEGEGEGERETERGESEGEGEGEGEGGKIALFFFGDKENCRVVLDVSETFLEKIIEDMMNQQKVIESNPPKIVIDLIDKT